MYNDFGDNMIGGMLSHYSGVCCQSVKQPVVGYFVIFYKKYYNYFG